MPTTSCTFAPTSSGPDQSKDDGESKDGNDGSTTGATAATSEMNKDKGNDVSGTKTTTASASVEMSVDLINSFRDVDLLSSLKLFESSEHADQLGLGLRKPEAQFMFDSLALKTLEHKVEILQWQMYQMLVTGESQVMVNIGAKKQEQLKVTVPLNGSLRLPFGGSISTSPQGRSQPFVFCQFFGINFYLNGKPPDMNSSSLIVPAWAVKTVTKSADCFFIQKTAKRTFFAILRPTQSLLELELLLPSCQESESLKDLLDEIERSGANVCCLPFLTVLFNVFLF